MPATAPRILVVDDDAFVRRPLELILRAEGFDPVTACNGQECRQRLEQGRPDLILLDVMMPGEDGFSLCARIKADPRHRAIPVILLSARGQEADRERGLAAGADDFVSKPYSPRDLVLRVRAALARAASPGA